MLRNFQVFLTALIVLICDRISKLVVLELLAPVSKITLIENFLSFYYVENTGAAFSILSNHIDFLKFFSFLTVTGIISYFIFSKKTICLSTKIAWGLILGGSFGNLTDRVQFGYVIDFISLDFINFAIFNIADAAINFGVIILIVSLLNNEHKICHRLKK